MKAFLEADLENKLTLSEIAEFERKAQALGLTGSQVIADLIREKFFGGPPVQPPSATADRTR